MGIPFSYNLRNLQVRKITTLMTGLGAALSVVVLIAALALVDGLRASFDVSASAEHLLVMRSGSTSELVSVISRKDFEEILSQPGIAKDGAGAPMASLEVVTVVTVEWPGGDMNVNLRGIGKMGWEMRTGVQLQEGRMFRPGLREIIVGKAIAAKCPDAHVGGILRFGDSAWTVVGVMDGGESAFNSEIFGDLNQVSGTDHREDFLSSVLLQAGPGRMEELARSLRSDRRLNVSVESERTYYAQQMGSASAIWFMGTFVAAIMAMGSAIGAMNTMYAAVARRSAEIGILRVLGFSRGSVLASFLLESVSISLFGGALGCLLTLPLNNLETGIGSFNTWNQLRFHFQVTPLTMLWGLVLAIGIGVVGGFLPAHDAAKRGVIESLRAR